MIVEIPGKPQAKQRPRMTRYGTVYTPSETTAFERKVSAAAKKLGIKPVTGPVIVNMISVFPIPKSWPKYKKLALDGQPHTQKPDKDNLEKCVLDGLNGHAYFDDGQVFTGTPLKFWSSDCGEGKTIIRINQKPDDMINLSQAMSTYIDC